MSTQDKFAALQRSLREMGRVLVCFSGGVDSSFLLRVAHDVLGREAIALTTVSPTNPEEDTEEAVALAAEFGVEHVILEVNELEIPNYRRTPSTAVTSASPISTRSPRPKRRAGRFPGSSTA